MTRNPKKEGIKVKKIQPAFVAVILALFGMRLGTAQDQKAPMSFFVTSQGPGNGANLGGLAGAGYRGEPSQGIEP
jgi:hypothetical protein